jgi:hypothetical protein
MECACIGSDYDSVGWDFGPSETFPSAKKRWKCEECGEVISVGEKYACVSGKSDGDWFVLRTCMDCHSVTEHLFCGYISGCVWSQLSDHVYESGGEISWAKIAKLTPMARVKVCDLIEQLWEKRSVEMQ